MNNENKNNQRTSLLRKNILVAFLAKGCSAVILLLSIPITLKCLGEYTNGVWLTISSLLLWIDNMDIGLGNGLRNKIATYLAHDDLYHARAIISSTFAMLTLIITLTIIVLLGLILSIDLYSALNVIPQKVTNLSLVLMVTVLFVCITFIFKLTENFYMGLQLPAVSNLLITSGQALALIGTYLIYLCGSHSLLQIALVNTAAPLIVYILAYPITFYYKYPKLRPSFKLINLKDAIDVMRLGVKFFVLQISGVVLFMSSNILISRLFSPSMVTPYQITYRYFSLLLAIFTVICTPFWNATTDAYERNDMQWILTASKKLNLMTLLIFLCAIIMVAISDIVYSLWIGDSIQIDLNMSITMATYIFILIYSMRYSYLLNGFGKLHLQIIFTAIAAVIFIPLSYAVVKWTHDINCFVITMCIVNIPGLIINRIQFTKIINGNATGIWNRA